jgi:hypothetical protein
MEFSEIETTDPETTSSGGGMTLIKRADIPSGLQRTAAPAPAVTSVRDATVPVTCVAGVTDSVFSPFSFLTVMDSTETNVKVPLITSPNAS